MLLYSHPNGCRKILNTILQKSASTEELPKIYAVQSSLGSLLFAVSSLLFGFLSEIWGVQIIFIISAMLLGLSAIYAMVRHHRFSI